MKKLFILSLLGAVIFSCNNNADNKSENTATSENTAGEQTTENGNPSYDPERGTGKFTNVQVDQKLNTQMADAGLKVYDVKCSSCHKLTDEKLVGPGWKGVTQRHKPEWIMNFVTNTDEMLAKDPKAQAQLEICLVRMPNQNVSDEDARNLYEFMRKNDGVTP
jgi:cytochrome c551/c552